MQSSDDRRLIAETIYLHGHIFDEGELERLNEIFTEDVVYDLSDLGAEPLRGIEAIRRSALALGEANPLAHHVTNLVITDIDGDAAATRCKAIAVMAGGECRSATYVDSLRREDGRWRIDHRTVLARRAPLRGGASPRAGGFVRRDAVQTTPMKSRHAVGEFVLRAWDAEPYDQAEGADLARVSAPKEFRGDLDGTSEAELLTVYDKDGNPAVYVGIERVNGSLHGRSGSFVLHHTAPGTAGEPIVIRIIPSTATGALAGLTGTLSITGDIEGGHTYALDYSLD